MKSGRKAIVYIIFIVLGITLLVLGCAEVVDSYWSGMGTGLLVVSTLNLIRIYRFRKDDIYREKVEVEISDERNRFIRNKAWAWAGYLFIIVVAIAGIVLKVMNQEVLSSAASYAVCLMMILYWGSYLVLRKKY